MGEHQLEHFYLQHCIPGRSSDHSILVDRFALLRLGYPVSLVFQGCQDDQEGPDCRSVLHQVDLEKPKIVRHVTNSEMIKEEKERKLIMGSWGSICHPVIISSILNPPPRCWDRNNTKNKKDEATGREISREMEKQSQILDEMQPSRASGFLFTWGKLTYQNSLQQSAQISNQYFDWSSMCQTPFTTNISQRQKQWRQTTFLCAILTHQTFLCIYFRFQTLLWWQETFWGVVSASSPSIDRATVNRKSQHRHGFITVSSKGNQYTDLCSRSKTFCFSRETEI